MLSVCVTAVSSSCPLCHLDVFYYVIRVLHVCFNIYSFMNTIRWLYNKPCNNLYSVEYFNKIIRTKEGEIEFNPINNCRRIMSAPVYSSCFLYIINLEKNNN